MLGPGAQCLVLAEKPLVKLDQPLVLLPNLFHLLLHASERVLHAVHLDALLVPCVLRGHPILQLPPHHLLF